MLPLAKPVDEIRSEEEPSKSKVSFATSLLHANRQMAINWPY